MSMVPEHAGRACAAVLICGFAVSRPPASCESQSSGGMDLNALATSVRAETAKATSPASSATESTPSSAIVKQLKTLFDRAAANSNALGLPKYMAKYSNLLAKENTNASSRKSDKKTQKKNEDGDGARIVLEFKSEAMAVHFERVQEEEAPPLKHVRESFLQRKY